MYDMFLIIPTAFFLIHLVFGLIHLIGITRLKMKSANNSIPVSVIVCAKNELDNLKLLIPALENQQHENFEIIIVDDRSDDGTYEFMLDMQSDQVKHVRIDKRPDHIDPKKYAITLGIKAAQHEHLLFTDADCLPNTEHWISEVAGQFEDKEFVLGVSQYIKKAGFLNNFIRFETLTTAINYIGFGQAGNPYMAVGRNLAYRKSVFLDNKGFNGFQDVTGGDDDLLVNQLANKRNASFAVGTASLTNSIPKESWSDYRRQKIRHISVSKHYQFKDKLVLGLQAIVNIGFWTSLVILAVLTDNYAVLGGLLAARMIFAIILYQYAAKKFGDRIIVWLTPVLDIFYVFYVVIFGTLGLFTKRVRWTN